jgi:hypothetical protein
MRKNLLFLGGTCGANDWRNSFTQELVSRGVSANDIFNPVVADWTPECQAAEDQAKSNASHNLFFIANPLTPGNETSGYSLVELTMGLYDSPEKTVGVLDTSALSPSVAKALKKAFADLKARFPNGHIFDTLEDAIDYFVYELS